MNAARGTSAEASRPQSCWHSGAVILFFLCWLTAVLALYLGFRFHSTAPKVPGAGAVFEINNHGDVRYLTASEYYGSFGLLFASAIVGIGCGVVMSILEGRKKK